MIKAANWLTHVEKDWSSPIWRHWMTEFAARFRYIRYDSRGCGLSDRDLTTSDLTDVDVWTADLEDVADTCGAERFVLFGMSQGAVPAIAYAVRHPERVSHLVLYGAYAQGMRLRDPQSDAQAQAVVDMVRAGWVARTPRSAPSSR